MSTGREVAASVGQRLLWLMDHYRGGRGTFNEQVLWRLTGPPDVAALRGAVTALTERHEVLRTTFVERSRQLTQVVHPPRPVPLSEVDTRGGPVRAAITAELRTPIDPGAWPTRATLLRVDGGEHVLCLSMHHLVTDDWSNSLISRELRALYHGKELEPVGWQYADWAGWQRETLAGAGLERLLGYWRRQLDGAALPALRRRDTGAPPVRRSTEINLDPQTIAAFRTLARAHRTTLFTVMLAVFYTLLYQRTGQDDLTVASLFANRSREEVQQTVGFFVNMVALRGRLDPAAPFTELVRRTRGTVLQALLHQDLPYQMLPPKTIASATGRPDDVMFQLLDPTTSRADLQGEELDDLEPQIERSRFDLELAVVPLNGTFVALMMYTDHVFDADEAYRFVRDYKALTDLVAADPTAALGDLRLL
ncbi:MAG TPA: condensation domain-containing protein [Rugosimonospora sp.]|nr:condensation domain-containing protein [Rugosimonospora sp.]